MNQDKIWNHFQGKGIDVFSQSNARLDYLFKNALKIKTNPIVLNIGVGNGWLEKRCKKQGWETYSLDPSPEAILRLEKIGIDGKAGYIENIPYADNFFDIIFCSEVIEHLSDVQIQAGLLEIERVLKQEGALIGTVPYKENLIYNQVVCPKCGETFHRWGHQQTFDCNSLLKIFPKSLTIQKIKIIYFVDWSSLNWKGILNSLIKKGLTTLGIHGNNENLFFIVKK